MTFFPGRTALVALVAVLGLAACSNGEETKAKAADITVTLGEATVVGGGAKLTTEQRDSVTDALMTYIADAIAAPLERGALGNGLDRTFEPGALAAATGPDRAALLDEGAPTGATTIAPVAATVQALAGADDQLAVIATTFTVDATTTTAKGPLKISRTATFAFFPDGTTWKVRSYDVTVNRELPGAGTSTTAAQR
jgi:hypothetical protein